MVAWIKWVLLLLLTGRVEAQSSFRITTVAGSASVGDGGLAVAASLSAAEGLAFDAAGNLFIADSTGHRIRRVDRLGQITTVAGNGAPGARGDGGPAAQATLNSPYGLAFDPTGNLLIADFGNRRVRKISPDGKISTVSDQFQGPRNLAVDAAGNVFVSDYLAHRVYRISAADGLSSVVATDLNYPAGLAWDRASGALYVADSGNKAIRRVLGGQVTNVTTALGTPVGLARDLAGNLYIADPSAERVFRLAANGSLSTIAESVAARDVAVDPLGTVVAAAGGRVLRLSSGGAPAVLAGGGTAAAAALDGPMGIALDGSGNLFIAEERGARVRRMAVDGSLLRVAGGGSPPGASPGDGLAPTDAKLIDPVAVAWDPVAGLRIVEYAGNCVRGVLPSGGRIFTAAGDGLPGFGGDSGPASVARLNRPRGVVFDREGNLYVADSLNHRVRRIGANGFMSTVAGSGVRGFSGDGAAALRSQLNTPQGVAVDPGSGTLYIADTGNNAIRRVSPNGIIETVVTGLNAPVGVALDGDGRLLIADTFNHRVRRVNATGMMETIAGDGAPGYWGDGGPAAQAQLNAPTGLAVDTAGRIYIADFDNNRVRRLDPDDAAQPLPPPAAASPIELTVMNAASLRTGPIAPGAIVSIFAPGAGPARAAQADAVASGGRLPFSLGGYSVRVDGLPAAMFYAGPGQFNIEAPRALAPKESALVQVSEGEKTVASGRVEVWPFRPALFTAGQGVGQALALNEDGSLNSETNPAARGSVVTLFGTGDGETEPMGIDGVASGNPPPRPLQAVQAQVGSAAGTVLFAGRAPGFVGLFQINVQLPGLFTPPGVRALTVTVGRVASQPGVTIAVK